MTSQPTLAGFEPEVPLAPAPPSGTVVRVLPDVVGIDRTFDYLVPEDTAVEVGDLVSVALGPRRVEAWVLAVDVEPPEGVTLQPIRRLLGRGPSAEVLDVAAWAAWRWAGRRPHLLRRASPPARVRRLPAPSPPPTVAGLRGNRPIPSGAVERALDAPRAVLRLAPNRDRYGLILAAVTRPGPVPGGQTLVLCPSVAEARDLGRRLRRDGITTAVVAGAEGAAGAGEWARARAGAVVIGARAGAWAPVEPLGRVVVLDEHDAGYQEEAAPTWHARDVAIERARRAGAPCLLVSPVPTLEALAWGELFTEDRAQERDGWPRIQVVDQRELDPALGPLFSPALVELVRRPGRVLCVLNRTGRAKLLSCGACATLARCEVCDAAVAQDEPTALTCHRCGTERPLVCLACGGSGFKNLRLGLSRAREELEALAGRPVEEISGDRVPDGAAEVLIGTEAVLHRVSQADAVAFLDFDQELLALRYRAGEEAVALLVRAARLVRRAERGRPAILVQSRTAEHAALHAAVSARPELLAEAELSLRQTLGLPPVRAMAVVSGPGAPAFMANFGRPEGVAVQGPVEERWRILAADAASLADALAAVERPAERLRIEVDPLRA